MKKYTLALSIASLGLLAACNTPAGEKKMMDDTVPADEAMMQDDSASGAMMQDDEAMMKLEAEADDVMMAE